MTVTLQNYHDGAWHVADGAELVAVKNPATDETLALVPLSRSAEVDRAVQAAARAFPRWRTVPPGERIQFLFKLKSLLEGQIDEIARTITRECGKTYQESLGELRRGIENVETACGMPLLMQGHFSEDIATGIDETMIRQPLGVVGIITPFNFPGMIPLWFLPYAIATGNTIVFKPSEKTPLTAVKLIELLEQTGLPAGVVNLVHGGKDAVDALLDHPTVRAISFVGSSPVARYVYGRAAASGKRVQAQGGAKNPVIVLPDADLEMTGTVVADSAFGCAGQRCLATSIAVTVGAATETFGRRIAELAAARVVGQGLEPEVQMGPVISATSKQRIEGLIASGARAGAAVVVDGRGALVRDHADGYFVRPTILRDVAPDSELARTEVFGPVLSLMPARDLDEAITIINRSNFGNQACLFTSSGAAARKFRYATQAGNLGINLGVAAPLAYFPFSGWKGSFFGDLHAQGRDAVEFFTDKKVVIERWG
jgi:malonate-semialdehyde dehydrogenase (acetylating)/methylmalonate-semialdehyde dehydrogenase